MTFRTEPEKAAGDETHLTSRGEFGTTLFDQSVANSFFFVCFFLILAVSAWNLVTAGTKIVPGPRYSLEWNRGKKQVEHHKCVFTTQSQY